MMNRGEGDKSNICKNQLKQKAAEQTIYVSRGLSVYSHKKCVCITHQEEPQRYTSVEETHLYETTTSKDKPFIHV
jgi:hypothetical protein